VPARRERGRRPAAGHGGEHGGEKRRGNEEKQNKKRREEKRTGEGSGDVRWWQWCEEWGWGSRCERERGKGVRK